MKQVRFFRIALCAIVVLIPAPAHALKLSPFKTSIPAGDSDMTQVFRVENNSAESAAVQVSAQTWQIRPDGTEIDRDDEDDFVVFPAQIVLKPHESKAVRLQWLGPPSLAAERAYRVLAEQVPIVLHDTPQDETGVRFLLRFKGALYITPAGAQPDVTVQRTENRPGALRLYLRNDGTAHTLLRNPVVHLALQGGRALDLAGAAVKPMSDENMHAGGERFFDLKLPPEAVGRVVSARLDFENGF
jgi:fimbrial chaperone protein